MIICDLAIIPDVASIPSVLITPDLDWCAGIVLLANSRALPSKTCCTQSKAESCDNRMAVCLLWGL